MYRINDMPSIERPREKLIKYGVEKLSNPELLAILLRTGRKGQSAVTLAKNILKSIDVKEVSIDQLQKVNGIGEAKACEIIACIEIGRRFLKDKKTSIYLSPEEVWDELKDISKNNKEHFIALFLDSRNQEIKREIISIGTLNSSLVHPREVFESAVKNNAASIMIAHNHPSNNPDPSEADINITKRLVKAGNILGIAIIDHVIICQKGYFSFKENNLI